MPTFRDPVENLELLKLHRKLDRAEEWLLRAEIQQRVDPDWIDGQDRHIAEAIAEYTTRRDELRALVIATEAGIAQRVASV